MKCAATLAFLFAALLAAQSGSVLPPDIQQQVDRIRGESHLKTDPEAPPAPAVAAPQPMDLEEPGDAAADLADMQVVLAGSAPAPLDQLETSSDLQKRTEQSLKDMIGAARRRVERAEAKLVRARFAEEHGRLDAVGVQEISAELTRRRQTLELASERAALLGELIEMAQAEVVRPNGARLTNAATLRYDGSGRLIRPAEFATLSANFTHKFAKRLPVSAWGESMTHAEMGFDHRGRIDVAVFPDSTEGMFIRTWLEKQRIPYFAFRHAMPGRATGPHIHIGPGSARLVRASLRSRSRLQ
jgi:hypothetical protein